MEIIEGIIRDNSIEELFVLLEVAEGTPLVVLPGILWLLIQSSSSSSSLVGPPPLKDRLQALKDKPLKLRSY